MGSWWANRWYVQNFEKQLWESYSGFKSKILICDFSRSVTWAKPFTNWFVNVQNSSTRWYLHPFEIRNWGASRFKVQNMICYFRDFWRGVTWANLIEGSMTLNQSWAIPWYVRNFENCFLRALGSLSPKILFAISDFLWVGQNFFMARFAWVRRQQNCDVFVISKLPCGGASEVLSPKFWFAIYDFVWLGQNFLQIDSKMGKTLLHDGLFKTLKFASGGASHFKVENLICDFRYFRRCVAWAKLFYDSMYLVSSWATDGMFESWK